jgi:rhodanese-related sulfurtransferase
MGWGGVAVIRLEDVPGSRVTGPHRPLALGLEHAQVATMSPVELQWRLEAGTVTLVDLEYSKPYRNGHIPGGVVRNANAAWRGARETATCGKHRTHIARWRPRPDRGGGARSTAALPVHALEGGTRAWTMAGYPLAKEADRMADTPDDVWLPARERGSDQESAMRAYLAWEIDLVNQMATDDDQRFKVAKV